MSDRALDVTGNHDVSKVFGDHRRCCSRELPEILAEAAARIAAAQANAMGLQALDIRQAIENLGVALHRLDDEKRLREATDWLLACERGFR